MLFLISRIIQNFNLLVNIFFNAIQSSSEFSFDWRVWNDDNIPILKNLSFSSIHIDQTSNLLNRVPTFFLKFFDLTLDLILSFIDYISDIRIVSQEAFFFFLKDLHPLLKFFLHLQISSFSLNLLNCFILLRCIWTLNF